MLPVEYTIKSLPLPVVIVSVPPFPFIVSFPFVPLIILELAFAVISKPFVRVDPSIVTIYESSVAS